MGKEYSIWCNEDLAIHGISQTRRCLRMSPSVAFLAIDTFQGSQSLSEMDKFYERISDLEFKGSGHSDAVKENRKGAQYTRSPKAF